jgi:hypothetical protein
MALLLPGLKTVAAARAGLRPNNIVAAQAWIERHVPPGAPVLMDWAYVPDLRGEAECRRRTESARQAGSPFAGWIEKQLQARPAYDLGRLGDLGYNVAAIERSPAQWIITSSGCYNRFLSTDTAGWPDPAHPLYQRFMRCRAFYKLLFAGQTRFRRARVFSEGSGPVVLVYGTPRP